MRAFEIFLNGKKLCTAGIGNDGVLSTIVNWVAGNGEELFMHVGGLHSPTDEHVAWVQHKRLRLGDRIQVKIVDRRAVDKPATRQRVDSAELLRREKSYVRAKAKKLGWKISIPRR